MSFNDEDLYFVYSQDTTHKYFVALHAAVFITMGNDVAPRGAVQVIFATFGLFMGAIINATIFGELAVIVSQLSVRSAQFQTKLTKVNTTVANLKLPRSLAMKIKDFMVANQSNLEGQDQLQRFLSLLSPQIKAQVIKHEFYDVVKRQSVFGFDERVTAAILDKLSLHLYQPEWKVTE